MTELAFEPASVWLAQLRDGLTTSRALLELCLSRETHLRGALNAVVTLDVERARAAADESDRARARGYVRGVLAGLPMTIKDAFEVAGVRTTSGAKPYRDHVPTHDALAVARLRDAGAIIFGKTNTSAFCGDVQSFNPIFGTTNNPYDVARTPGGSSGGAAAALAAGITPLELGSDLAGSIRTPSGFCGIYGHKPSYGLVPQDGHIPGPPGQLSEADMVAVGPMARSAEDLCTMLEVVAGPAPAEARAYRLALPKPRAVSLRTTRVATWFDDPAAPIDRTVRDRLTLTAESLRRAGVHVEPLGAAFSLGKILAVYRDLLDVVASLGVPLALLEANAGPDSAGAAWAARALMRHRDWLSLHERRLALRREFADVFTRTDVILCPITPTTAFPHDHHPSMAARRLQINGESRPYLDVFSWIAPASLCGLPATVAPLGAGEDALPVGVQIVGPYLEDLTPIDFAARLSSVIGGFSPPPKAR